MCGRYDFSPPSSTRARQAAATQVQLQRGSREASLVTKQLCHSQAVQSRYYEATVGKVHAAKAFAITESLRMEGGEDRAKPKPTKRVPFTEEQTQLVEEYFCEEIARKATPSTMACTDSVIIVADGQVVNLSLDLQASWHHSGNTPPT